MYFIVMNIFDGFRNVGRVYLSSVMLVPVTDLHSRLVDTHQAAGGEGCDRIPSPYFYQALSSVMKKILFNSFSHPTILQQTHFELVLK